MERVAEERSRVPSHLRRFHHHEKNPAKLNRPCAPERKRYVSSAPKRSPPRIHLTVRDALKDIISKDWTALALHASPHQPRMAHQPRPGPIRMKDSDDYITERAANPRTGLVSPSLESSTPCRESTPNTPGDALKLLHRDITSPTPDSRRGMTSRENGGRRISAGSQWTSYRQETDDDHERAGTPSTLPEDCLVVHMPSAKEPQPFAYPGYSSEQIEAFEHYRRKARRVSSEGYDQRLLQSSPRPSSTYGPPVHEQATIAHEVHPNCSRQGISFRSFNFPHEWPQPQLTVQKRRIPNPVCQRARDVSSSIGPSREAQQIAEISQSTMNPAKLCIHRKDTCLDDRHVLTCSELGVVNCSICKTVQWPHASSSKTSKEPFMAPRRESVHDVAKDNRDNRHPIFLRRSETDSIASDMTDLRVLPRVTLAQPEHAAKPFSRGHFPAADGHRACSSGCRRDVSGKCFKRGKISLPASADGLCSPELPTPSYVTVLGSPEKAKEVLVGVVAWLLCYVKGIQLPQNDLIETLRSPNATVREKVDALKAALTLAGHVLAVGTALAMIWQLSAAVVQLLHIALWPLAVPFRILKWLMGAA